MNSAVLLVDCPDAKGLVASISRFLFEHGANILDAAEHRDNERGRFFMRVEFDLDGFDVAHAAFAPAFQPLVDRFGIDYRLEYSADRPKTAIFVSRYEHCLVDLLYRHRTGELRCDVPLIVGNHEDAGPLAAFHGIPFHYIPVTAESKAAAEATALALLDAHGIELIVLARYMQILSPKVIDRYPFRIINIHPSLLPYHPGPNAYRQAWEEGVRVSGCTAHFVTEQLDAGPVILQDVFHIRVGEDALDEVKARGQALEGNVLSRAVQLFLNDELVVKDKKVMFRPGRHPGQVEDA